MEFMDLLKNPQLILLGLLGLSFVGSSHCIAMCGPLNMIFVKDTKSAIQYHTARLLGYLAIAISIYFFKDSLLNSSLFLKFKAYNSLLFTALLLLFGIYFLWNKKIKWGASTQVTKKLANFLARKKLLNPFSIGFSNAFLPCAWLYSFFLLIPFAQSSYQATLWTFAFWLPNAVVLGFGVKSIKALVKKIPTKNFKQILGVLLIVLASIRLVSQPIFDNNIEDEKPQQQHSCH